MTDWISVGERIPDHKPAEFSEPVMVLTGEFGQEPVEMMAVCWRSSLPDQPVVWEMKITSTEEEAHGTMMKQYLPIAEQVTHWRPLTEEERELYDRYGSLYRPAVEPPLQPRLFE